MDPDLRRQPPHHLNDFKLYVSDMEELKLPVNHYVTTMAKGLAFLHWECRVDGNGVEFVLGQPDGRPPIISSPFLGDHTMWMIDYDRCAPASMDEAGVECMVTAVLKKDHQYPLPFSSDATVQELWSAFSLQYLRSSLSFIEIRDVNRHEKDRMTCLAQKALKGIELMYQIQAELEDPREEWKQQRLYQEESGGKH